MLAHVDVSSGLIVSSFSLVLTEVMSFELNWSSVFVSCLVLSCLNSSNVVCNHPDCKMNI
jgi:hypothetical protein